MDLLGPQLEPLANTPEKRAAFRMASMERRIRMLERKALGAPKRIYAEALGNTGTAASSYVALTGGPSITVDIQENQMVIISTLVDCFNPAGGGASFWGLYEPTDFPSTVIAGAGIILGYNDTASTWKRGQRIWSMASNTQDYQWSSGTADRVIYTLPGALMYYPTPGARTYSIRYGKQGDFTFSAQYENRKLWVVVI